MFTTRSQVGNLNEVSIYGKYDHEDKIVLFFSKHKTSVFFSLLLFSRPYKNSQAGKAVNGNVGTLCGLPNWRASSTQATTWFQPLKPTKEYRCNVSDFLIVQIHLHVYFYIKPLSFKCWFNIYRYTHQQALCSLWFG